MLRLVFASVSILALANCDALWSAYEVPCDRGFSCPDGGIAMNADLAGSTERDGSTVGNDDGSTTGGDGSTGPNDMGDMGIGPTNDMNPVGPKDMFTTVDAMTLPDGPTPLDMLTTLDMVSLPDLPTKLDDGGVIVKDDLGLSDLGADVKGGAPVRRSSLVPKSQGQAVVPAGRAKR